MSDEPRQKVVRVPGSRRARLTAVPGTEVEPRVDLRETTDAPAGGVRRTGASGPNDERMRNDVPPHYGGC